MFVSLLVLSLRHCLLLSSENDLNVALFLIEWKRVQPSFVDLVHQILLVVLPVGSEGEREV